MNEQTYDLCINSMNPGDKFDLVDPDGNKDSYIVESEAGYNALGQRVLKIKKTNGEGKTLNSGVGVVNFLVRGVE